MAEENAFAKALAAAQAEMDNATFDKVNPHFKSKYASLASVRAAAKVLHKHGFSVIATTEFYREEFVQKTELLHVSGESRFSYWPISPGNTQQKGSDNTYGRRYGLSGFANIASEDDDDGNAASASPKQNASQVRKSGLYVELEKECRLITSLDRLKTWWASRQDDIRSMPAGHRALIEEEKDRRKLELADQITELRQDLAKSLELTEEEVAVIDQGAEEIVQDLTSSDPQAYLNGLDGDFATVQDTVALMEIWNEHQGIKEVLTPRDQEQAQAIFEKHHRRLRADEGVKAFKEGKKK